MLAEAGCSELEISSITGHRSLAMVAHYTRQASQASDQRECTKLLILLAIPAGFEPATLCLEGKGPGRFSVEPTRIGFGKGNTQMRGGFLSQDPHTRS